MQLNDKTKMYMIEVVWRGERGCNVDCKYWAESDIV